MKRSWVQELHKRFSLIYLAKFTASFPDGETMGDWCEVWAERLADISGTQLKYALDRVTKECPWPPTLVEFLQFCEAAPKPPMARLPAPKRERTEYAERCIGMITGMLANPKPAGPWWKAEVLAKVERGEAVSATAYRMVTK